MTIKKNVLYVKAWFLAIYFFIVLLLMTSVTLAHAQQQDFSDAITPQTVIQLVNQERASHGLPELQQSETLQTVAEKKIANMVEEGYFGHVSPRGEDPWKWFAHSGYDFSYAGENLATDFTTARAQHQAWMNSIKHKKNILDKRFTHTGVATKLYVTDGERHLITVQVFATPQTTAITSPNYTPGTFEVPEELIHRGNDKIKNVLSHENHSTTYRAAGLLSSKDSTTKNTDVAHKNYIPWMIVLASIVAIIIAEYYIFLRRKRRSH